MIKVLIVTNMWPSVEKPYYGLFVKEQIDALQLINTDIKVEVFNIQGYSNKFSYFLSVCRIRELIKNHKFDVIHIHFGLSGLFLLFLRKIQIPIVCTFHGSDISASSKKKLVKWISFQVAKRCTRIVVLNNQMVEQVRDLKIPYDIIPCGVDTDFFRPSVIKVEPKAKIVIGFPSNPNRIEKNYPLFANIVQELRKVYEVEIVEELFVHLNRTQISEKLNAIHILLMTSHYEGSPQIIKEAMACNCKIVSRDVGDVRLLFESVGNAAVLDYDASVMDYVGAIKELMEGAIVQGKVSSRERLLHLGLTSTAVAERVNEVYNKAINGETEKN